MLFDINQVEAPQFEKEATQVPLQLNNNTYMVSSKLAELLQVNEHAPITFWLSNGDYSAHELLIGLLEKYGPAEVYISSYAFSEKPARLLADLKQGGVIKKLYCVVDNRIDTRSANSLTLLKNCCDKLKLLATHAKVTVLLFNDCRCITIIGSANYTENVRYEAGVLTDNVEVAKFHCNWMQKELQL